jgi:hypothetical protein
MVISLKGMLGTVLWAFGIVGFFIGIGLMGYAFTKKEIRGHLGGVIEIKERPDPPPPPTPEAASKHTPVVSLEELKKDKTIH